MSPRSVRVGLIGLGTVGTGVVRILQQHAKGLENTLGARIELSCVAVRDRGRPRDVGLPDGCLTDDAMHLVQRDDIDVVIEVMGGTSEAKRYVLGAIEHGKHVVTANKALIALEGRDVFDAAHRHGVGVYLEASVAGGIPIVKSLHEGLAANKIESVYGILNGTCNYILTEMSEHGTSYDAALSQAQDLGYAEADPSFDVGGDDTAHKIAILASLAFGFRVDTHDIFVEGIADITSEDIEYGNEFGYVIKLLAISARVGGRLSVRVHSTMVPESSVLANVRGAYNAVAVVGDAVGPTLFYGQGAGQMPTASAIVADLMDAARAVVSGAPTETPVCWHPERATRVPMVPMDECSTRYYLRLQVEDRPGVLADVATILARHDISLAAVSQKEPRCAESVPVVFLTHTAREGSFQKARREIDQTACVREPSVAIRVETEL